MKLNRLLILATTIAAVTLMSIYLAGCAGTHGITDGLGFTHHKDAENERIQQEQYLALNPPPKAKPPCRLTINGVCQGPVPPSDADQTKA